MSSDNEPDDPSESRRRDPAAADLEAFTAMARAADAETKRLQAIVEQTNTAASAVDEMVEQLRAPLQLYEEMGNAA